MTSISRKIAHGVVDISERILYVEMRATTVLMALILCVIVTNVVTRLMHIPLYWIDELAVFTMVWLTFVGTSAMTRLKLNFSIDVLPSPEKIPAIKYVHGLAMFMSMVLGLVLLWMSWVWLDPVGIIAAGFDAQKFAGQTFNFLYLEYTQTLEWPRWAVMLIVPIFSITLAIHSAANVLELAKIVSEPSRRIDVSEVTGAN